MSAWPTRDEVRARWHGVLDGSLTREQVHAWTVPWVEGAAPGWPLDGPVESAMQTLHGFTMASDPATPHLVHHGPPGVYLKSPAEMRSDLERWEYTCREHDLDPAGWRAKRLEAARAYVENQILNEWRCRPS
jgi:hypothetical protein